VYVVLVAYLTSRIFLQTCHGGWVGGWVQVCGASETTNMKRENFPTFITETRRRRHGNLKLPRLYLQECGQEGRMSLLSTAPLKLFYEAPVFNSYLFNTNQAVQFNFFWNSIYSDQNVSALAHSVVRFLQESLSLAKKNSKIVKLWTDIHWNWSLERVKLYSHDPLIFRCVMRENKTEPGTLIQL
jgi:hypothetical protein